MGGDPVHDAVAVLADQIVERFEIVPHASGSCPDSASTSRDPCWLTMVSSVVTSVDSASWTPPAASATVAAASLVRAANGR